MVIVPKKTTSNQHLLQHIQIFDNFTKGMLNMRNPNGFGTVKKLSGKRRKPWGAFVTVGYEMTEVPKIDFLKKILSPELYAQVQAEYDVYKKNFVPKAKQIQKCITTEATQTEALLALAEYNKKPFDLDKAKVTFEDVYNALYDAKIKKMIKKTQTSYVIAYKKCEPIKNIRMRDLRTAHMQKVIDQYMDKSRSTQNGLVVLFHAMFDFCLENDICEKDYSQFVKITSQAEVKEKKPLDKKDIETIWKNLDWLQTTPRKNPLTGVHMVDSIIVMLYTGMRIGELLAIKPEDVHINERWIKVRGTKTKAADRIVPIHKKLIPLLEKRLAECTGETLYCGNDGKQLKYYKWQTMFFELFINEFKFNHTAHECRHTFATVAAASSMNKLLLKKMIGHSSSDITEDVYTHAYVEDLVREIDKFDL